MQNVRLFEYDKSMLSESERRVVDILLEAGNVIHKVWQRQVDQDTGRLTVYPEDATKEEILAAAEKDPALLSGTTLVRRVNGKLEAVDYIDEYGDDLKEFSALLTQAKDASDDPDLKIYIDKVIKACSAGDYQASLIAFLENPQTKIEFSAGPFETYEDNLLGRKKTFQFNLRVLNQTATQDILNMIDVMKNIRLPQPETSFGSKLEKNQIQVRIDDVLMFAGRQSTHLVSSANLPNEPELVKKYGTKVVVFTTSMSMKFDKRHVPLMKFFCDNCDEEHVEKLRAAMFNWVALHEIAEGTVKFSSTESRLKSNYDFIRELNAHAVGLDSAKYHILNGFSTLEQYQDLLMAFAIFATDMCNHYQESGALLDYAKGFAVMFNIGFRSGAFKVEDGKMAIDYTQLASDLEALSHLTLRIMEQGDEDDANKLLKEYGDFAVFDRLPKLK
ncbi:hypothetical protein H6763_02610 [Candidatus Nomurabacteria bacterium]|nr:hypothetical protein [Candidatus Nomurabacteria bacterium]MCB9803698.1 hypothetical protein [Candidatus Nomurabacteria bacterium]